MNAISKFFAVAVALVLLYMVPTYYSYERLDDISGLVAEKAVTRFVDSTRDKGYISPQMYNDFMAELQSTGNTYTVDMVHEKKKYDPVYNNAGTFQNAVNVNYDNFYNADILAVVFPNTTADINADSRRYKMVIGDFFSVSVKNTNKTNASVMQDTLNGKTGGDNTRILIPYGGMIYNEDY